MTGESAACPERGSVKGTLRRAVLLFSPESLFLVGGTCVGRHRTHMAGLTILLLSNVNPNSVAATPPGWTPIDTDFWEYPVFI